MAATCTTTAVSKWYFADVEPLPMSTPSCSTKIISCSEMSGVKSCCDTYPVMQKIRGLHKKTAIYLHLLKHQHLLHEPRPALPVPDARNIRLGSFNARKFKRDLSKRMRLPSHEMRPSTSLPRISLRPAWFWGYKKVTLFTCKCRLKMNSFGC